MINKLLTTCLHRNKRLVLPTLGAFIGKNIDGLGVVLVFVPFLKNDDGILFSAIKSWAGVEDEEAKQIMDEYIAAIKESLDTRGQYLIEGVGVLKYDVNHIICLEKEPEEKPQEQSLPVVEQPVAPVAQNTIQPEMVAPASESVVIQQPQPQLQQEPVVASVERVEPVSEFQPPVSAPMATEVAPQSVATPPVIEPQNVEPQQADSPVLNRHNQNFEHKRQHSIDMGARYFSPKRDNSIDTKEDELTSVFQREKRISPNAEYASSQRADVNSVFARSREQSRINNIYGSTSSTSQQRPSIPNRERAATAPTSPQTKRAPLKRPTQKVVRKKQKGNDIVLWIAIIAVILTIIVLVYGFLHGGNQTLEPMYDDVSIIQEINSL
ncbi:MAG: hypothetical protein R3Y04_00270 [Rikenellaceae bacterium]